MRHLLLLPFCLALTLPAARGADELPSPTPAPSAPPCVLVMASFPEELAAIEKMMVPDAAKVEKTAVNGIRFDTVEIGGKRCVFFLTGMSLVNAASSTQLAWTASIRRPCFSPGSPAGSTRRSVRAT